MRPVKTGFGTGSPFPRKIRVQSYTRDRGVDFDPTEETIISTVPLLRLLREGEIEEEKERGKEREGEVDCEIRATITREEKGERERERENEFLVVMY